MNNQNIVYMTNVKAVPGKEQTVLDASLAVAAAARAQAGCVDYYILRSPEDPAVTMNFERWSSDEARDTFLDGPDVEKFGAAVSGAFAEPPQPVSYLEIG